MVGCAEKPAKLPGAEKPPKKNVQKVRKEKKTPNRKEAQDGRPGVDTKGLSRSFFNRKIRFAT
jgi:hypothetical protein